ncbi:S-layer homology domain-containing protein [Aquibacillus salsiterrae]|uniref:S-layer homology domain-containing protein n=1 Tax=Aquibacillus salsiterrae TaxID=2950439 RepID=A0A9X3WCP0_9BACI|nr:S-layer homology domain-containing protein [Aquibacillus salsiterrae]MDC3417407.1 S-layer homology domain-containing protein [Aquibacillus salsiterrae]
MNWKKVSAFTISSAIMFGGILPTVKAEESVTSESKVEFGGASATTSSDISIDSEVSIEQLVEKIKQLFPSRFESAKEEDFNLDFAPYYPDQEDVERLRVYYYDRSSSNPTNANFEFVGVELELTSFYYSVQNRSDALFPPKVSEEDAAKIAESFLDKTGLTGDYQLSEESNPYYYNYTNQPLTEPIEYRFNFDKLKDGIPVQGRSASVTVLGNGEVTQYNSQPQNDNADYESTENVLAKDTILEQLKQDLNIELQYIIQRNNNTQESTAYLTYREIPSIIGISAKDGKYNINGDYVNDLPEKSEIQLLAKEKRETKAITKDEAKALATKLLETDEEGTTLQIEGVIERENPDGTKYYEVRYMYRTGNGGFGSTIRIKQDTGELISYYGDVNYNPSEEVETNISEDEALKLAVDNIKEYANTSMDEYAYPLELDNIVYPENEPMYRFTFPRVKNGLIVNGDSISVGISKEDGRLLTLNSQRTEIDSWPAVEDAVSKDEALDDINEKLDVKLYYVNNNLDTKEENSLQYKLSYLRNNYNPTFYNAVSGEWESSDPYRQEQEKQHVTHPWAEEELNFMIDNNIITVDDPETFNGNAAVTKGEALEILSKSLTRIYQYYYGEEKEESPFTNIGEDHPLYDIVMRSVEIGIIDDEQETFDLDGALTRENLSYWYVRALGLDSVAKRADMFNYDFADVDQMSDKYKGYVVLTESFGLLTKNDDNNFRPQNKVTYAQLAVANLRLAKLITSEEFNRRF